MLDYNHTNCTNCTNSTNCTNCNNCTNSTNCTNCNINNMMLNTYNTPLIYPDINENTQINQFNNVLLIDNSIQSYDTFINAVNSDTFPITYSTNSTKIELHNLLKKIFNKINRIGLVFTSSEDKPKYFLDNKTLFINNETETYSENLQFIINIIKEFNVQNIDFLACNTLLYQNYNDYYQILTLNTQIIVGASNDKTGNIKYGGDWVLESTNQDIQNIYFNNDIQYYNYLFDTNITINAGQTINNMYTTFQVAVTTLNNNGTISGVFAGIGNRGTITTLNNNGTITTLINHGTITTLNNKQGASGNNPLTFVGRLGTNYNIIINSTTDYGQLSISNPFGTLAFGISPTSNLSAGTYAGVLQNFGSNLSTYINSGITGTFDNYNWSFSQQSGSTGTWDLVIVSKIQQQAPLTITNTILTNSINTPITLGTSGGSGTGAITYTISPNTYTISGNQLTVSVPGSYTVTATKASDATYASITSSTVTFTFIQIYQSQPVYINMFTLELKLGEKINILQYNSQINPTNYIFYSSDNTVATINNFGIITTLKKGYFYIIITDKQGNIVYTSYSLEVIIQPIIQSIIEPTIEPTIETIIQPIIQPKFLSLSNNNVKRAILKKNNH